MTYPALQAALMITAIIWFSIGLALGLVVGGYVGLCIAAQIDLREERRARQRLGDFTPPPSV